MQWRILEDHQQLEEVYTASLAKPVLIYKHNTRCPISYSVLSKLESNWEEDDMDGVKPYFLDLLAYRNISDTISTLFDIEHESPQLLVILKGKAIYGRSHFEIDYFSLKEIIRSCTKSAV